MQMSLIALFAHGVGATFCPCGWDGQSVNMPHGGACCCSTEYGDDCKFVHGMGYCPSLPYEPSYDHNPAVCCYDPSVMEYQANHGACTQEADTKPTEAMLQTTAEGPFCPCGWDGQSVNMPHGGACCCSTEYGDDCKFVHGMGYCPNLPYEPSYDHNPAVCCYDPSVMEYQANHGACTQEADTEQTETTAATAPASLTVAGAECSSYYYCEGLAGDCCPTVDGVYLDCCTESSTLAAKNGTAAPASLTVAGAECSSYYYCEGLAGDCCPTVDGVYLDCCTESSTMAAKKGATAPASLTVAGAACSSYYYCEGLAGDCCPTVDGVYLDCCTESSTLPLSPSPVTGTACSSHPACEGLAGDCCPTIDGVYLDCCATDAQMMV